MALELGRRGAKVIVNYANSTESAEEVVRMIKKSGSEKRLSQRRIVSGRMDDILKSPVPAAGN